MVQTLNLVPFVGATCASYARSVARLGEFDLSPQRLDLSAQRQLAKLRWAVPYSMRAAWFGGKEPTREGVTPEWVPDEAGWDRIREIKIGQIYDLEEDPGERTNLFQQHPDIVSRLRERLEKIALDDRSRALN